jgi:hypothetical protein
VAEIGPDRRGRRRREEGGGVGEQERTGGERLFREIGERCASAFLPPEFRWW